MQTSITDICNAITETLGTATGIARTQSAGASDPDEMLTEGLVDMPLLQVYWQSLGTDGQNPTSDRRTFGAGVRLTQLEFRADVYAKQRANIGEDMARVLELTEAVITVLEAQNAAPFGLDSVKAYRWGAERVTFEYAGASYAGIRFTLTLTMF